MKLKKILKVVLVLFLVFLATYLFLNFGAIKRLIFKPEPKNNQQRIDFVANFSQSVEENINDELLSKSELAEIFQANWLYYPSLKIEAPIEWDVTLENMDNILGQSVAHLFGTSKPDIGGEGLIAGHSSYYPWEDGKYKDIFAPLINAKESDSIIIRKDNKVFYYKVIETYTVKSSDKLNFNIEEKSKRYVYLMTCVPIGTNINRFIVRAEMEKFISLDY